MNAVNTIFKGNLVADPVLKEIGDEKNKVVNFVVATTRYFVKKNGEKSQETAFIPCEAWDTAAEAIEGMFEKGDPIFLQGFFKTDSWEKDGQKHSRLKVRVSHFEKLYRRQLENAQ